MKTPLFMVLISEEESVSKRYVNVSIKTVIIVMVSRHL